MVSSAVGELVGPVNEMIFRSIPILLLILAGIVVLVLFKKFINYVVYRLHKKDVHRSTNKWWSWEEYENEKKTKV